MTILAIRWCTVHRAEGVISGSDAAGKQMSVPKVSEPDYCWYAYYLGDATQTTAECEMVWAEVGILEPAEEI